MTTENDIYNSKGKYEKFLSSLQSITLAPENRPKPKTKAGIDKKVSYQYYCKNPVNITYFRVLARRFDVKETSYVRRLRLFNTLKLVTYATEKDLKLCSREDINDIVIFMHTRYNSPKSKLDFVRDLKFIWRVCLPELDEKGRIDEKLTPYPVRHLDERVEKSKEKARGDKFNVEEFISLVSYFSNDKRIQAYLTLALESLGRPQELLYLKLKDIELYDGFAKVWVNEHGKEGVKMLQASDSYPYVRDWFNMHPYRADKNSFFFVNWGDKDRVEQLKPFNINKKLRLACKDLGINKPITCYSLKRAGVSFDVMAGKSSESIRLKAGWTTTKQLTIYSNVSQEDNYFIELIKKGKINDPEILKRYSGLINGADFKNNKVCLCGQVCGFSEELCPKCARPLDQKDTIKKQIEENTRLMERLADMERDNIKTREILKVLFENLPNLKQSLKEALEKKK